MSTMEKEIEWAKGQLTQYTPTVESITDLTPEALVALVGKIFPSSNLSASSSVDPVVRLCDYFESVNIEAPSGISFADLSNNDVPTIEAVLQIVYKKATPTPITTTTPSHPPSSPAKRRPLPNVATAKPKISAQPRTSSIPVTPIHKEPPQLPPPRSGASTIGINKPPPTAVRVNTTKPAASVATSTSTTTAAPASTSPTSTNTPASPIPSHHPSPASSSPSFTPASPTPSHATSSSSELPLATAKPPVPGRTTSTNQVRPSPRPLPRASPSSPNLHASDSKLSLSNPNNLSSSMSSLPIVSSYSSTSTISASAPNSPTPNTAPLSASLPISPSPLSASAGSVPNTSSTTAGSSSPLIVSSGPDNRNTNYFKKAPVKPLPPPPGSQSPLALSRGTSAPRKSLAEFIESTEGGVDQLVKVQAIVRRWLCWRKFKLRVKTNIHRTRVVREIVSSEENYVAGLLIIHKTYLEQLQWNAKVSPNPFLTTDQITSIFSTVAGISTFNQTFIQTLRDRMQNWGVQSKIGDVFCSMGPFLKLYFTYCSNYDQAIQALQKAKLEPQFSMFLETCMKSTTCTLESLLITVVQRIPRYILLLQDLLKNTWPEHPDYEDLQKALKIIQEIAARLNKGISDAEKQNKVISIQAEVSGLDQDLVTPSRAFVKEGPLLNCSLDAKAGKDMQKVYFFLFNDALLITDRKKDEKYQHRNFIPFSDQSLKVKDLPEKVLPHAFQVVSATQTVFVAAEDDATKNAILSEIKVFREQKLKSLKLDAGQMKASNLNVTIPRTQTVTGKKEYTLYHIKINDETTRKNHNFPKRYSDFDKFHRSLKKEFPTCEFEDLPKKHLVGSLSKDTVESRRVMLELYLQHLVQKDFIRASTLFHDFMYGFPQMKDKKKKKEKDKEKTSSVLIS